MRRFTCTLLVVGLWALTAAPAMAGHSWGGYHWGVESTPFALQLDNNLTTPSWQAMGANSSQDWSNPDLSVLRTTLSAPKTDNKRCKASAGRVEVCNGKYGNTGWLGLAQIWLSGTHITQGTAKMNDTYLLSGYSLTNRQHVLCQEVGHTFGLGHVSEDGFDHNTCMDYAKALDNPDPNGHDFEQLGLIYNHSDGSTTVASSASSTSSASSMGSAQMRRVKDDLFVQDFGGGRKIYTFVFWADRRAPHGAPEVE